MCPSAQPQGNTVPFAHEGPALTSPTRTTRPGACFLCGCRGCGLKTLPVLKLSQGPRRTKVVHHPSVTEAFLWPFLTLSPDTGSCSSPAVSLCPCVRPVWATAPRWPLLYTGPPVCLQPATGPCTPGAGSPRPADLRGGCSLGSQAPALGCPLPTPSPTLHGASALSSPVSHVESPTLLHIGRTAGLGTARVFNPIPPCARVE